MLKIETFQSLQKSAREAIIRATFNELTTGVKEAHSLMTIKQENRDLAVGCRMIGKGYHFSSNNIKYDGKDTADIFIDSVKKFGKTYYRLRGDWTNTNVKQLILFVKSNNSIYQPYARFDIRECKITNDVITTNKLAQYCTVPEVYDTMPHKTLLEITNVQTTDLPKSFMGITSGKDIYDKAFKGGAPSILMI